VKAAILEGLILFDKTFSFRYIIVMEKILEEIEKFKQDHPDIAKAMEIFEMGMEDYQRAYRFLHEPKTYTSNTTFPTDSESE